MIKVVGVKFVNGGRIYYFSPSNIKLKTNDFVIVETERGMQVGKCATNIVERQENEVFAPLKDVIRIATKKDKEIYKKNIEDAKKALVYVKNLVNKEKINMKIYDAEYSFDKKKLIFKFISDDRVDFRDLAKKLASKYKTRIELRQIGARDKAKEIGGLGPCGKVICCKQFINNFDSVSINMAKNQGIALNPSKINGLCGRLLCCFCYEDEIYTENKKEMPKIGDKIKLNNKIGKVFDVDILNKKYSIITEENEIITSENK